MLEVVKANNYREKEQWKKKRNLATTEQRHDFTNKQPIESTRCFNKWLLLVLRV